MIVKLVLLAVIAFGCLAALRLARRALARGR
jgi:hypothetical protein